MSKSYGSTDFVNLHTSCNKNSNLDEKINLNLIKIFNKLLNFNKDEHYLYN